MAAVATAPHLAAGSVDSASPTSPTFAFHAPPRSTNAGDVSLVRPSTATSQVSSRHILGARIDS